MFGQSQFKSKSGESIIKLKHCGEKIISTKCKPRHLNIFKIINVSMVNFWKFRSFKTLKYS